MLSKRKLETELNKSLDQSKKLTHRNCHLRRKILKLFCLMFKKKKKKKEKIFVMYFCATFKTICYMKFANQFYTKHCVSKLIISIYSNALILIISSMNHFDVEISLQLGGPIVSESTEGSCH